jgi:hypothetical protein
MTKVFIGGSRRVSRLNEEVWRRLDKIIEQGFPVVVGDANGADKAVQKYLHSRGYDRVEVFCTNGECRNNIGNWPMRAVAAPKGWKGFRFYAAKDQSMAEEASVGLMIWDERSIGTLTNMFRLVSQHKKVVVYTTSSRQFSTLTDESDWKNFLSQCARGVRDRVEKYVRADVWQSTTAKQARLL